MAYLGVSSSVIPDGLEPSLSGCRPEVVAAGPRDQIGKVDSSGIAPESSVCRTDVFLLDHEPELFICTSGSRGTRTHKRDSPAACFQDRFLSQPDDFRNQLRELESNQRLRVQSPASLPAATIPHRMSVERHSPRCEVRQTAGAGIEPADSSFKATDFYQQKLPRNGKVPCGNRTRLFSLEG